MFGNISDLVSPFHLYLRERMPRRRGALPKEWAVCTDSPEYVQIWSKRRIRTLWGEEMTALATLIAIAAWCGSPALGGITAAQVDQCRQELRACLDKTPHNQACFMNEKVGK